MNIEELFTLSAHVGKLLKQQQHRLVTAESCTGGGVAYCLTEISGSSAWFEQSFVTYSNEAKQQMLGVQESTLIAYGAVSEEVAKEMAQGALAHSNSSIAVAISGIAGPNGGSEEKPVGTVCFAWASNKGWQKQQTFLFSGNRGDIRYQAIEHALLEIASYLS